MNVNDIEFAVLPFKKGWYWSRKQHKMFMSDNIENIVYEAEDIPVKMQVMKLQEMIEFVKAHPGDSKAHRTAVMRIVSDRFALKENVDMSKWNNVIYVDLDMKHFVRYMQLTPEQQNEFYDVLDYALQCICPDNYFYIEHSSSLTGIHCMFYFDCERNEENYFKYAQYVYEVFRYKISEMNFIKDFSMMFDNDELDGAGEVWDEVYKRPYQKLYITAIDYRVRNCNGRCDDIVVNDLKPYKKEAEVVLNGTYDVKYKGSKKLRLHYYDRLKVVTALKKYVGDENVARKLWYEFCDNMIIPQDATLCGYRNDFDKFWNSAHADSGEISWLRKFGFNVDDTNLHIHLKDNEYISDVVDDITSFCVNGLNLLESGTGTGKTEVWKKLYKERHKNAQKPMLIVEPMNSIVDSKYDSTIFEKIIGKTTWPHVLDPKKCYITNYNHLVTKNAEGKFEIRADMAEFFGRFELVIVDESHIMMKDEFRSDVLIPFMQTLNMIDTTKVILQTATPLFERSCLNVRRAVTIHKASQSKCKLIYRQMQDPFNILQVMCLVNYYVRNGRKVYIYWKNGSLQNMNMLKTFYPDAMVVYHKRANGSPDMQYINDEHDMQPWDVMISSVYFGVGNDLNDNVDKAAVIIIGNNVWQEDIQAVGRWRRCKDIEVCIVMKPNEAEMGSLYTAQWNDIYSMYKRRYITQYNDKLIRNKSTIINNVTYEIKDASYIDYIAKINASNDYSMQVSVKNDEFKKLGYDVREIIKPLETNDAWVEECRTQRKGLREARRTMFKDFFDGLFEWDTIRKDSTMERCARTVKKLLELDLIKYCDLTHLNKTHICRYATFLQYYCNEVIDRSDYSEIMALLYVRKKLKEADTPTKRAIHTKRMFNGMEISALDYYCIYGYSIWLTYRNKGESKQFIEYMYYDKFVRYAEDLYWMEDSLVHRLFVKWAFDDTYKDFIVDFLNISDVEEYRNVSEENLIEYVERMTIDDACVRWLQRVGNKVISYITNKKSKGGMKGSPKKQCTIAAAFKNPARYNISVGDVFPSASDLAQKTGVSLKTITQWRKKQWVV